MLTASRGGGAAGHRSCLESLAMAHHRRGEADAARRRLAELRAVAASAAWANDRTRRPTQGDRLPHPLPRPPGPVSPDGLYTHPDLIVVCGFVRQADGDWLLTTFAGFDADLAFAAVPARVKLGDIYAGVTFPENPGRPPSGPAAG